MTKKSKSKTILLDTVVVIDGNENGYWVPVCNACRVLLPATIIEKEALYFHSDRGKMGMNPTEWVKEGKITPQHFTKKWFQQALAEGFCEEALWLKEKK